ncbi:hypothetical protein [Methanoculleus chikugoensis]|uniref:Uncharacterized protein n=1 Tax=Methanoculleus chikugoensis TaxID=118126 RepID=A0ABM7H6I7_9EURY|nr:hypothetical protein [Methanoculleus chikugoensis]BBL68358.1 hypothetical protein MchiMG62_15390 [Methanoculleus chikugoensis]
MGGRCTRRRPGCPGVHRDIQWEEDLIFITRDRTYRNRTAYLVQEYRERTGSALTIARQDIRCPGADPV